MYHSSFYTIGYSSAPFDIKNKLLTGIEKIKQRQGSICLKYTVDLLMREMNVVLSNGSE
jgi:hypothetical protein